MATSIPTFSAPTPSILRLKNFPGVYWKTNGFWFERKLRVRASAKNEGVDAAEEESRGESTMPERFRYLTKEAPDPPVRWPWLVVVLLELANWRKAAVGIVRFVGYLLKLILALIFHFIVAYAPIPELTTVIILASTVLVIAEAVVPNAVNCQPFLLTTSGVVGYAAVAGYISEPFFWTILAGGMMFTSALPAAAVMSAIGEPWVRVLVIASYLALAIFHHSKKVSDTEEEIVVANRKLSMPLLGAGLAIGIRVAAMWAGYRHLTWMIV
ncbi:unnamed protein product [Malus baccata var. baccata]